ncbi:MAG TPA: hypothetical protein PK990_00130 [Salinivirgaceae bacterium]|nr:hypothetical protein [Salinivirgaceae bacterium]
MKRIFLFTIILFYMTSAESAVTIKFKRVDHPQTKERIKNAVILISLKDINLTLKPNAELGVEIEHDFSEPIKIKVATQSRGINEYSLKARPNENYVFEVGFDPKYVSIKLVEGKELGLDEKVVRRPVDPNMAITVNAKDGFGFVVEKADPSENIRQEWLRRGGKIKSESILLSGTYFNLKLQDFDNMEVNGYGGGVSVSYTWYNLKIPTFKTGLSTWNNFCYGFGYDMLVYYYSFETNESLVKINLSTLNTSFPIYGTLGYTIGLGKFIDEGNWKGIALTFKYRPSLILNMSSTKTTVEMQSPYPMTTTTDDFNTTASFSGGGFGFDLEFSNFSATMSRLAPPATTKFSLFILPPVKDLPLFVTLGLGITFYSR